MPHQEPVNTDIVTELSTIITDYLRSLTLGQAVSPVEFVSNNEIAHRLLSMTLEQKNTNISLREENETLRQRLSELENVSQPGVTLFPSELVQELMDETLKELGESFTRKLASLTITEDTDLVALFEETEDQQEDDEDFDVEDYDDEDFVIEDFVIEDYDDEDFEEDDSEEETVVDPTPWLTARNSGVTDGFDLPAEQISWYFDLPAEQTEESESVSEDTVWLPFDELTSTETVIADPTMNGPSGSVTRPQAVSEERNLYDLPPIVIEGSEDEDNVSEINVGVSTNEGTFAKHPDITDTWTSLEEVTMSRYIFARYNFLPYHYTLDGVQFKFLLRGGEITSIQVS